jgi:hypothetical protein
MLASETSQPEQKMALSTKRQKELAKALTLLIPGAPFLDAETIREAAAKRAYKRLPHSTAVWLACIAHIRHVHTDYDALLDEGYEQDAARHLVLDTINGKLTTWRASRYLDADEAEDVAADRDMD